MAYKLTQKGYSQVMTHSHLYDMADKMPLVNYVLTGTDYDTRYDEISQETQLDCISLAIDTHNDIIAITI